MKAKFFFILLFVSLNVVASAKDAMIIAGKAVVEKHSYKMRTFDSICWDRDFTDDFSDSIYLEPANRASIILLSRKGREFNIGQTDSIGNFEVKINKDKLERYNQIVFSVKEKLTSKYQDFYTFKMLLPDETVDSIFYDIILQEPLVMVGKPAIYLYPTEKKEISVKLDFKGNLGATFPAYKNGWDVIAKPNGEIFNKADNRQYNYLFWEGNYRFPKEHYDYESGFVVAKNDIEKFLIDKLGYVGLNNTEINDFIVYWLPVLRENENSLIHFFINDNIDESAFLDVAPKPDTQIRLFMEFQSVEEGFKINTQELPKIERKGFTLVEWGGGITDNNVIK